MRNKEDVYAVIQMACTIILALVGSTMLKLSNGFVYIGPTIICAVSYCCSYYLFALALRRIPLTVGYAVWSGFSTVGNSILGYIVFDEALGIGKISFLCIIVLGTILINNGKKQTAL